MRSSLGSVIRPLAFFLFVVLAAALSLTTTAGAAHAASEGVRAPAPWIGVRTASAPPELVVRFEEAAVVVTGASADGGVAFYSVAREPHGAYQSVVRRQGLELADDLGETRFLVDERTVPLKSVWAVVDIASGAYAVAAPEGFWLREIPFPGRGFAVGASGQVDRLRHDHPSIDLLVVRPGVGAWSLRSFDRSETDRDGADDDRILTSLEDLVPLGESAEPPPESYSRDDVVVLVDPRELRYAATRLLGRPEPSGGEDEGGAP